MAIPRFMLRKLYRRGSLRQVDDNRFVFTLENPLASAKIIAPPRIVINGMHHNPENVHASIDLAAISAENPFEFVKGGRMDFEVSGRLLRGGNRLQVVVETEPFGKLEIFIDDKLPDTVSLTRPDDSEE